jgi:hypothetical protein
MVRRLEPTNRPGRPARALVKLLCACLTLPAPAWATTPRR